MLKRLELSSSFSYEVLYIYLPNLQSFIMGDFSFKETTSLSLSSISIQFYFHENLPNLQSFITGKYSFYKTTNCILLSMFICYSIMYIFPNCNRSLLLPIPFMKLLDFLFQVFLKYVCSNEIFLACRSFWQVIHHSKMSNHYSLQVFKNSFNTNLW